MMATTSPDVARFNVARFGFMRLKGASVLALASVFGAPLATLPFTISTSAIAQAQLAAALAGKVSSQEEGAMEGVVVSAKRKGSTIMVSVIGWSQESMMSRCAPPAMC
jgi:hypothetical protein